MVTEQSSSESAQPVSGQMAEDAMGMMPGGQMHDGGHLYMQTNEARNCVIHYLRAPEGTITEMERCLTGGAGSGTFNYRSEPLGLLTEGALSVLLTADRRFLFAVNAGDNSVSSLYQIYPNASKLVGYAVQPDGSLDQVTSASIPYNSPQGLAGF
jgi:hypothetical protein